MNGLIQAIRLKFAPRRDIDKLLARLPIELYADESEPEEPEVNDNASENHPHENGRQ